MYNIMAPGLSLAVPKTVEGLPEPGATLPSSTTSELKLANVEAIVATTLRNSTEMGTMIDSSLTLTTFELFPKLPTELRLKIVRFLPWSPSIHMALVVWRTDLC